MTAWYDSQGLDVPDEPAETIGGMAADVHRAADRATTADSHPLLWKATTVLEQTGKLDDVAEMLNEVLAPVVIDRDTDRPYPIIRFAEPPTVQPRASKSSADDIAALRRSIRRLGETNRRQTIALARAGQGNRRPDEHKPTGPGRSLGYWRSLNPEEIEAHAADTDRRLDNERGY